MPQARIPFTPLPRAGGVGEGSQHLREGFCAQTISRAKFNKDVKIRKADFFLNFPRSGILHSREARTSLRRRRNISRATRELHCVSQEGDIYTASLHSGSSVYVQNPEAELRDFEAQKRKLKLSH